MKVKYYDIPGYSVINCIHFLVFYMYFWLDKKYLLRDKNCLSLEKDRK